MREKPHGLWCRFQPYLDSVSGVLANHKLCQGSQCSPELYTVEKHESEHVVLTLNLHREQHASNFELWPAQASLSMMSNAALGANPNSANVFSPSSNPSLRGGKDELNSKFSGKCN